MLPSLAEPYALDERAIRAFRTDGHVRLDRPATPGEVAAFRPAILETGPRCRYDERPLAERDTYGRAFVQMFNLWTKDDRVRAFVFARRFAGAAAELMGVAAVRLYHDQALFKEPGGGFTPWHQDQFYWPLDTEHTITLWMPLVPITPEMGPMTFASGSQRLGKLSDLPISDASEAAFQAAVEAHGLACTEPEGFAAGDASFHAGWTLHRAPPNRSERMREVMTVIYFADGARVGPLDHPNRRLDRDVWLPGCEPEEPGAVARRPAASHRPVRGHARFPFGPSPVRIPATMTPLDKLRPQPDARLAFLQGFLRKPQQVGSVIPSSRFLERRLVAYSGARHARLLVELGPGTGGTTRALLRALPADGKLLAVELEPRFAAILREMNDPRLIVHEGSAEHLLEALREHGLGAPDAVISGIPFSTMDAALGRRIAQAIHDALGAGGRFVAYQVRGKVHDVARPCFGRAQVEVELRNIPPMRIYRWRKGERLERAGEVRERSA